MITVKQKIDMAGIKEYPQGTLARLRNVVAKSALELQAQAQVAAPVDTGALKNSIIAEPARSSSLKWTVSDGVEYGVFQELGTSRGVSARHFLGGAAEKIADRFFSESGKALQP